jgi:hypothetical protein
MPQLFCKDDKLLYLTRVSAPEDTESSPSVLSSSGPNMQDRILGSLMDSPLFEQVFSNPELLKSMFGKMNPQMKKIYEKNPELEHMLSDPAVLKETMKAMRNPEYQKEMMKNNDRAISNLETRPEGFNALRKAYASLQEPMLQALDDSLQLKLKDDMSAIEKSNGVCVVSCVSCRT